jgi:predicted ABC-type ATPase
MPDFTIVAGPNGAGKSTFSKRLSNSGALIFDADIIKLIREKQYPDLPIESIEMMIDSVYWEAEEVAIKEKKDFTVETNLRNDFLVKRAAHFRNKGYTINLVFMLLPDIQSSIDRVNSRVDQKGHYVDVETIKYNFEYSLENLKQYFGLFDNLFLIDSALTDNLSIPNPLLKLKNNKIHFIEPSPPKWAKPIIDDIIQKITTN